MSTAYAEISLSMSMPEGLELETSGYFEFCKLLINQ